MINSFVPREYFQVKLNENLLLIFFRRRRNGLKLLRTESVYNSVRVLPNLLLESFLLETFIIFLIIVKSRH